MDATLVKHEPWTLTLNMLKTQTNPSQEKSMAVSKPVAMECPLATSTSTHADLPARGSYTTNTQSPTKRLGLLQEIRAAP